MSLKIFKAFWFLSVLAVMANLLYTYATLPEIVIVQNTQPTPVTLGKDAFFYAMTSFIAIVNVMVYLVSKVFKSDIDLRAWFHGLVIAMNVFFIIALNYIGLFNSGEHYDYGSIKFIIYGSVALFVLWTISWPIYLVYKKLFVKESIQID